MKDFTVSFIGAGNMGEAMIRGLIKAGLPPKNIMAMDAFKTRMQYITNTYKVKKAQDLKTATSAEALVIAVKPKDVDGIINILHDHKGQLPLIISVAAGVPIERFTDKLGPNTRIVRVMPNTPALIGKGVSVYYAGQATRAKDLILAETILKSMGPAFQVTDQQLLDAVTGLSGSGPAYVFIMVEAMADGAVKMGLPRDLAMNLAAHTVAGAAAMVAETREHPAALKDKVASPGGTTIAGIAELERGGFRAAIIDAIEAATLRAKELA